MCYIACVRRQSCHKTSVCVKYIRLKSVWDSSTWLQHWDAMFFSLSLFFVKIWISLLSNDRMHWFFEISHFISWLSLFIDRSSTWRVSRECWLWGSWWHYITGPRFISQARPSDWCASMCDGENILTIIRLDPPVGLGMQRTNGVDAHQIFTSISSSWSNLHTACHSWFRICSHLYFHVSFCFVCLPNRTTSIPFWMIVQRKLAMARYRVGYRQIFISIKVIKCRWSCYAALTYWNHLRRQASGVKMMCVV